ncbi:unnamed protein product [Colias eurytheme]|nr:unnamed protein product [Colias eurytheme]
MFTYGLRYVPLFLFWFLGPGAFLPRPEDRRQPPFLDQLYASNGGSSMSMCHRFGARARVQREGGVEACWPAAPPGLMVAPAAAATLLARHAALARIWLVRDHYARGAAHAFALRITLRDHGAAGASRLLRHARNFHATRTLSARRRRTGAGARASRAPLSVAPPPGVGPAPRCRPRAYRHRVPTTAPRNISSPAHRTGFARRPLPLPHAVESSTPLHAKGYELRPFAKRLRTFTGLADLETSGGQFYAATNY